VGSEPGRFQQLDGPGGVSGGYDTGVGDDQRPRSAQRLRDLAELAEGSGAEYDPRPRLVVERLHEGNQGTNRSARIG
jgi:hypothetical protein